MSTDPQFGGLSFEDRQRLYTRIKASELSIRQIENMIAGSGTKTVGKAALRNVRVRHNSIKNGSARTVESHTCELVFAYELELDPEVLGYYVQVPCRRVQRTTASGRNHISTAHVDFLVFRRDRVELVECKPLSWLESQLALPDSLWVKQGAVWTYSPYAQWAQQHGLVFRVWMPPTPTGVYLQNLEACYAVAGDPLQKHEVTAVTKAAGLIAKRPVLLDSLIAEVPGFTPRLALWMLGKSAAFGPWQSTPAAMTDRFHLYGTAEQAKEADELLLETIVNAQSQPAVADPLLVATATDLQRARQRLSRLALIEAGSLPATRRMGALQRQVRKAVAEGRSALSACLTKYAFSGNRASRLLPEHEQAIETVIALHWNTGRVHRPKDLLYVFEEECLRLGVEPCGRARLDARRRSESPIRHALSTGGFRAYHAARTRTDPRHRSLPPIGYGHTLHVDSSDLDVRCAPNLIHNFPAEKAKFYIGIDGATGDTMAHSLVFGSARTDALALLMREYVKRHGFLPRMIHLDRGPENTSHWVEDFCQGEISLRFSPTAGSAWNGIAENAIKQVNEQVAQRFPGSTRPDQMGRKVDGKFKSRNNARTDFVRVHEEFLKFVYHDLPMTPGPEDTTPAEKRAEALAAYGALGTPCEWDERFLVRTAIKVETKKRIDRQRGVRTADGWYTSDELLGALRTENASEVRSDCCDPSVIYVKVHGKWFKAFHNRVQSDALLSDQERLFHLLWAPTLRAQSAKRKEEVARARHSRRVQAQAARPATEHLAPEPTPSSNESHDIEPMTPAIVQDIVPFDEREDY